MSQPVCFVSMPFREPFNTRYAQVYEPAIQAAGLDAKRLDRQIGNFDIASKIRDSIASCNVFLADISDEGGRPNGNVYHEVGFAQALRKPTITVFGKPARTVLGVPIDHAAWIAFNLQGIKHLKIEYLGRTPQYASFTQTLTDHLRQAYAKPYEFVVYNGKQTLDRDFVIDLMRLHMRSSRLAVLDVFEDMVRERDAGKRLALDDVWGRFGVALNGVRNLLKDVVIEWVDDVPREIMIGDPRTRLSMYFSDITVAATFQFGIRMTAMIFEELNAPDTPEARRARLKRKLQDFQENEFMPVAAGFVKSAYFDRAPS